MSDEKKVLLILVDGLRPEAISLCGHPYLEKMAAAGTSCLQARTVTPCVTLPSHTSLFMSVPPERHGVLTNNWTPMARPIPSLTDVVHQAGKTTAMFYNWEELRDLSRPGSLDFSYFKKMSEVHKQTLADEREMTERVIAHLSAQAPDFTFLYYGWPDEAGHHFGWLGKKYLQSVAQVSEMVEQIAAGLDARYQVILCADHGGHGRNHGENVAEDMRIPLLCQGSAFPAGKKLAQASIMDIAPTIARILGIAPPALWEGECLV